MILELDISKLFVVFDRRYSLSEFREASQVISGSYADELVERIHNCLFKYPRDLQAEYEKYYAVEYSDFAKFLYWKYGIEKNVAVKIKDRISDDIYVGYGRDSIGMFTDDTVTSVLNHTLSKLGEKSNENTD